MDTTTHKANAAAAGLDWAVVLDAYREARELEAADVARRTADRRDAFRALSGDTHGGHYKARHRVAFTTGDATNLAGLDVVAADRGATADQLHDDLAGDAPTMRPADETMAATIDRLAAMAAAPAADETYLPLVAAAAAADVTEQWLRQLVKSGRVRGRKAGRNWQVSAADVEFFRRHPTAGRPRFRHAQEPAPF